MPLIAVIEDGAHRPEFHRWGAQACLDIDATDDDVCAAVREHASRPATVAQAPAEELNRPARVQALAKTGLLDSPPDELFDRVARLMAHLLEVPVILMSLIDGNRQFFKTQVGVPEPIATARQTPITHSFCQWVVAGDEDLVVSDARQHVLLRSNRATLDLGIVAYAGVPLRGDSTEPIGSFCAIDMKPRTWDARELRALHDAARVVDGLTALRQAAQIPPATTDDLRAAVGVVGEAVRAAVQLQLAGMPKLSPEQSHDLLALIADIGRQLSEISGAKR